MKKKYLTRRKRKIRRKTNSKRRRKTLKGGSVLNTGKLFEHINFSNSFFPNFYGTFLNNINLLLGGKPFFKNINSDFMSIPTK